MIQTFAVRGGPDIGRAHLPLLRSALAACGIDALYLPHEDEYQNEYLPAANDRLAWATGFTGSAGSAVIGLDMARMFVDGRYTLQARDQVAPELFSVETVPQGAPEQGVFRWLGEQSQWAGRALGYDPALMSPNDVDALTRACARSGVKLHALMRNPVDLAWQDRPPEPMATVFPHPLSLAGEAHADKRRRMGAALQAHGVSALLVTSPASLAWLFNIRGGDVAHTPLPLGRALLMADGRARLFLHPDKCGPELKAHLGSEVRIDPPEALNAALRDLRGGRIGLDPANAPASLFDAAREAGCEVVALTDPSALARACKNAAEIAGVVAAHERDGVAVTRFLHWLATHGQSGKVTEIEAVETLEAFRQADAALKDLSFETISGAGPNGAIIHYRVSTATNRPLRRGSLFLVDSGGQYADGTTDVTRTVAIGRPSREMRERYTLVLKGHIALSTVRFPEGTTGTHLDILARHALWQAGLDYAHGTGHGVGAYLGVHEGPQRISKALNPWALQPGMIVSNEPGYYKENAYGIRIENLQYVTKAEPIEGGEIPMLGFATLTLAPLERALILRRMLTRAELSWVDAYHQRVRDTLSPRLDPAVAAWLDQVCSPL